VVGAGPQLCDGARGLLWDSVMRGASIGVPGSAALGDAALAPKSLGTADPGVSGLHLAGSPGFPPPPILEVGGGGSRVYMFIGHHCGEVVAQDAGLGRSEHPASDLG
jgi:hypothetical protein